MQNFQLMEVKDIFNISSIGVLVAPLFDLPPHGKWKAFSEVVTIKPPEGDFFELTADFSAMHLNIKDPSISVTKRWQIVVSFKNIEKFQIPLGSKVLVSAAAIEMVTGVAPK
jgi:hypothetical protein